MPYVRYFFFVGFFLLAGIFILDAYLPQSVSPERTGIDKSTIRVSAQRPVVERITIDTNQPTIVPSAIASETTAPDKSTDNSFAMAEDEKPVVAEPVQKTAVKKRARRSSAVALARPIESFGFW